MKADTSKPTTADPAPQPNDLLAEGARARKLSMNVEGTKALVQGLRLVNDTVLAQVLFALWDSGFYEFSLTHPRFEVLSAAEDLGADPTILKWLLDYLVGRGIVQDFDEQMGLTEHGIRLSNILLRGTLNLYVGGWGPQLADIGPLLRKEITQPDFAKRRSGTHTVRGTEQLTCVRAIPAVLKVLTQHKLTGVLHLACRNGEFLIELARSEMALHGIGVDRAPERISAAQANAAAHGVDDRVKFIAADVGAHPLPLDQAMSKQIDVVAALYLLHEVARNGRQAVVALLRLIKLSFPGRLLLFTEAMPGENPPPGSKPPTTFSHLDYLLIHRIRGQGLPLPPAEWKAILEESQIAFLEMQDIYGSGLYLAQL